MKKLLRIALVWQGTVMQEATIRPGTTFTLGAPSGNSFNIPVGSSGAPHAFLSPVSDDAFQVSLSPEMNGRVSIGGEEKVVSGPTQLTVRDGDWGIIQLGEASLYFQWVSQPVLVTVGMLAVQYSLLTALVASFFPHAILVMLAYSHIPSPSGGLELLIDSRFARIITQMPPEAVEEIEEEDMPDDESTSAAAGGEEGKFGAEDAELEESILPDYDGPLVDSIETPELGRAMNAAIGQSGALSSVFGSSDAFSNQFGSDFATAGTGDVFALGRGAGGLGARGTGSGGGGDGLGRVQGVGGIDTGSGRGQGARLGSRGERERRPQVQRGNPNIAGFLSREQIERVVRRHQRGIQYCYERELQNDGLLAGRISINWTIGLDGTVQSASVTENSMGNRNVESCILSEVRRMRFDQPDGGNVVVTYPFTFRSGS
jgi:hypothetical protein